MSDKTYNVVVWATSDAVPLYIDVVNAPGPHEAEEKALDTLKTALPPYLNWLEIKKAITKIEIKEQKCETSSPAPDAPGDTTPP